MSSQAAPQVLQANKDIRTLTRYHSATASGMCCP
jgi:hypothetical protein